MVQVSKFDCPVSASVGCLLLEPQVFLTGTGCRSEANRGKPQQSCQRNSRTDPQHHLHLSGPCRQINRGSRCVSSFFPLFPTAVFLCSIYHMKQLILITRWITVILRIIPPDPHVKEKIKHLSDNEPCILHNPWHCTVGNLHAAILLTVNYRERLFSFFFLWQGFFLS